MKARSLSKSVLSRSNSRADTSKGSGVGLRAGAIMVPNLREQHLQGHVGQRRQPHICVIEAHLTRDGVWPLQLALLCFAFTFLASG
jgi:hypothetical protein